MLKLSARTQVQPAGYPFVARLAPAGIADVHAAEVGLEKLAGGETDVVVQASRFETVDPLRIRLPASLSYLQGGDIVRIEPRSGFIKVLYRKSSPHNVIFTTERCNSYCLMCSQPPRDVSDGELVTAFLEAIPLMSKETVALGISGGEPALLGDGLLQLIRACKTHLPATSLHMLSNGRLFSYMSLCRAIASIRHPDLMIGIPLYSDLAGLHDFVVQARGAFDQTIRGILNLARWGVKIEVRVVLHAQTVDRLPQLARFIARNLPFVDHVALMGLEMAGFVKMNLGALWVDPHDYQDALVQAVREFKRHEVNVSIYNHQLCVLDRELWSTACKSISDWKNEYVEACDGCGVRGECGGFFSSSGLRRSAHIAAIAS